MDLRNIILVVLLAFVAWSLFRAFAGKIAPDKARSLVKAGARLVDVRTKAEHDAGHIPGSLHIPLGELPQRTKELGDKKKPVVVYCASGMRSASAAGMLKKSGFAEVYDLGAMARWGN
ncbi:MAG: rhodanese-like domain-containing protein [Polyangiaceae bacterium]